MAVVLITGCSSGFGRATALGFAARGDQVVATMRNPRRALASGGRAEGLDAVEGIVADQLDVTDAESRRAAVARTLERFGRIDVLVNNAGISALGVTEEMSDAIVDLQWRTNYFGPVELIKLVLPTMRAQGAGRIVNVTSIGAMLTPGFYGHYCATKHALDAVSLGFDVELQQFGVRVVTVAPGGFGTSMADNRLREAQRDDTVYPRALAAMAEYDLRNGTPSDLTPVVAAIVAAASDPEPRARYLVGGGTTELLVPVVAQGEQIHSRLRARDAP